METTVLNFDLETKMAFLGGTTLQNYAGVDKERSKAIHADIMNDLL